MNDLALVTCVMLTVAVQAAACSSEEMPNAEVLFRKLEVNAQNAPSLFVAYISKQVAHSGTVTTSSFYGGTFYVKPGVERVLQSFTQQNPYVGNHITVPTWNYVAPATRNGFLLTGPFLDTLLPVGDFATANSEQGADTLGLAGIQYTLRLHQTEPVPARQVQLWLTNGTLTPRLRTARWSTEGRMFEQVEHYVAFSTSGIPEPFERKPVAAFVASGRVSALVAGHWMEMPFLVESIQYRSELETRLLFGGGDEITLSRGTEWTTTTNRRGEYELRTFNGHLVAQRSPGSNLRLIESHPEEVHK